MNHFIVEPDSFSGDSVTITGKDVHHILDVLRLSAGDKISVAGGEKGRFLCAIEKITSLNVIAKIVKKLKVDTPPLKIILAQAIPKGRKMDDIIRMACELGVCEVIPVVSERCVVKMDDDYSAKKVMRWQGVATSAAKQSRASAITCVSAPVKLGDLPKTLHADLKLVLWEEETSTLKQTLGRHISPRSAVILIGPEGGFSEDEIKLLKACSYHPVTFGSKILRTETAGVAAISSLLYHYSK